MIFRSKPLSEAKHLKVTVKTQNDQLKLGTREVKFLSPNSSLIKITSGISSTWMKAKAGREQMFFSKNKIYL